jgi:hypothetical protein
VRAAIILILSILSWPAAAQDMSRPGEGRLTPQQAGKLAVESLSREAEAARRIHSWSPAQVEEALRQELNDRTAIVYQAGHGVYVEYTAAGGQLRMWYPHNRNVVVGRWGVRPVKKKLRACFKYLNSSNPLTGEFEPDECVRPEQTLGRSGVVRQYEGDVFRLMSGSIPYSKDPLGLPAPE